MRPCTRADCDGTGVLRGDAQICDVCFRGPLDAPGAPEAAEERAAAGDRCPRSGCDGTIAANGICDVCFCAPPDADDLDELPDSVSFGPAAPRPGTSRRPDPDARPAGPLPVWWPDGFSPPSPPAGGAAAERPAVLVTHAGGARFERTGPRLGLGLVDIPRLPARETGEMILSDPLRLDVGLRCTNPACRADLSAQRPAPSRCPRCDTDISLRRPLAPGETVGHQYRIQGCVGRGGQGWVYLAHDLNLDNDRVAVKGLRDRAHQEMFATELLNLIAVKHPDIVAVRNYVTHRDPATDRLDGYIVMEFVDGVSLADKAVEAGGRLPVAEALAYVLATLPALGYLHDAGLVYGDYKPQNIMQAGERVKLVDLGAVTRIGPRTAPAVWATQGFAAPEVHREGAAGGSGPASDIYCVGRSLAVLTAPFKMIDAHGANTPLPTPDREPVFAAYESFYRLLLRATAPDPRDRFGSVGLFAEQLTGVLREVTAIDRGTRSSAPSLLFTAERAVVQGTREDLDPVAAALALPTPRPDGQEPEAALLETAASALPADAVGLLAPAAPRSAEAAYKLALAHIALGDFPAAHAALEGAEQAGGESVAWRATWYRSVLCLAERKPEQGWQGFAAIRDALPGEAAPKLALAACAEAARRHELARHYYATVWNTDDAYVGAAFGVARCGLAAATDPAEATDRAIEVLEAIPERLHLHVAARIEALRLRLEHPGLDLDGLRRVVGGLRALNLGDEQRLRLEVQFWISARAALREGRLGGGPGPDVEVLDVRLADDEIGRALERCHLLLRRYAPTRREVAACARAARLARPRTWW